MSCQLRYVICQILCYGWYGGQDSGAPVGNENWQRMRHDRYLQQQRHCYCKHGRNAVSKTWVSFERNLLQVRRTYINTCRSYVHTPRDIDRHAITEALPTLNFTSGWVADSSDFGLLGEQIFPKWENTCPRCPWTTVQNLTPLALSLLEKSVTVQTNTHKNTNSNQYIHTAYRHVWIITVCQKQSAYCCRMLLGIGAIFRSYTFQH